MSLSTPVTIAYGNGIGPEIMEAVLLILESAKAPLSFEEIEIGESIYNKGLKTGIEDKSWESLYRTKVFLKAPITTPQGGGFSSLNVSIRKQLGLYANVRPCASYHPFVSTKHPKMDVVIIRENEEDLYTGMEYQQTSDMVQGLKIISQSNSLRIARYAFEYALQHGRQKVSCFTKDNIMKRTDGLFRKAFEQVGDHYPQCEKEHWIIDIGAAKLAYTPENFDVVLLPNLYGDILSDVTAQISGSVGMAGSANIGNQYAMFEAIHGSAPRRAGQNLANPSGLLQAGILLLQHIGQNQTACKIQNSWLKTLEEGLHTYDIYQEGFSQHKMGTKEFAKAIVERLGEMPKKLKPAVSPPPQKPRLPVSSFSPSSPEKTLVGVDIFIDDSKMEPAALAGKIQRLHLSGSLQSISSRGLAVWPGKKPPVMSFSDHWRLRFIKPAQKDAFRHRDILQILSALEKNNIDFTKTEHLYYFDQEPGFSK